MYEGITYDLLLQRMLDVVSAHDANLDTREGSVAWLGVAPAAVELQNLYLALDTVLQEAFADTASREYLVLRAAERGLAPYSATPATLKMEVTPPTVELPMSARFSTDSLNYAVTNALGNGGYEVTCETAGEAGNTYGPSLVPLDFVDGLETCKITGILVPGEDAEDTEVFRRRYFDSLNAQAFGGNRVDYIEKADAIPGVGGVRVYRAWNGNLKPADMIPPEETEAWIKGLSGVPEPVKLWLDAVYAAAAKKQLTTGGTVKIVIIDSEFAAPSTTLIQQVQDAIDPESAAGEGVGIAPIGHVVKVYGVENATVNLSFSLSFQKGWSWEDVKPHATKAVQDYFGELAQSWSGQDQPLVVRVSQVESRVLALDGVLDIAGTQINGAAENCELPADHIPVLGSVEHQPQR